MIFGFCASTVTKLQTGTGEDMFEAAVLAGYDYIELPVAQFSSLDEEEFSEYVRKLRDSSLPCLVCNNLFPGTVPLTGNSLVMSTVTDYFLRVADRIQSLEAKKVVFGSPAARQVPQGFSRITAISQIQRVLEKIAPIAASHHFEIAIEPIADDTSNIINTLNEAESVAKQINLANVGTMAEYYQMLHQEKSVNSLKNCCGKLIKHVHIANSTEHAFPLAGDGDDYKSFFELLQKNGYSDTISIEGKIYDKGFIETSRSALELLRGLDKITQ